MDVSTYDRTTDQRMRCPTCGAKQTWSDACRRCKCDLTFLRSAAEASRGHRRRCLLLLRAGRHGEALRQAQRAYALHPDPRSARLLAVCHLLCGHWISALAIAQLFGEEA